MLLREFRRSKDWDQYAANFEEPIEERGMVNVLTEATRGSARPCLLCACPSADHCHRRLIAEAAASAQPGLRVEHLR